MDSMQTRHRVLGDASWTREKVSEARMWLVTSRCPRIRAPKLKHAAWQNGARPCIAALTHAALACSDPARSIAPERKIHGGMLQLAFHKVQHTSPGLACSPDQAKSRCWAPQAHRQADRQMCRAVPGAETVRGSVTGLRMNLSRTSS